MLPVDIETLPKININGKYFYAKQNYHVSLLCLEKIKKSDQMKVLELSKTHRISLNKITNVYRLAKDTNNASIIVRVKLQGLKKLISEVNNLLNTKFTYPPTHITLFVLKDKFGIGINSNYEYKQITHNIGSNSVQKIKSSFKVLSLDSNKV